MDNTQKQTQKPDELLTAAMLAERLGLEAETIRRWAAEGLIPSYRCGNRVIRFDYDEVKRAMRNAGHFDHNQKGESNES